MKWEYLVEIIHYKILPEIEDKLNEFGNKGWEVCVAKQQTDHIIVIVFKKQKDGSINKGSE